MTKDEALKLALDKKADNARELGLDYEPENTLYWYALNYRTAPTQNAQAMFEALEKFVEAAIKEALAHHDSVQAKPEPEQKPVAWLTDDEREALERFNETCEDGEGYDVPKPMMKRLAEIGVIHHTSRGIYGITKFGRSLLGYTTPPQRTWVGLADYEIDHIYTGVRAVHHEIDSYVFARAIEAKLKERNT